jgi:hypothetical protein
VCRSATHTICRKEAPALAISSDLLEILVCPADKAKVELKADGSGLKCVECHRVYPIRDDIPVMLIDEATIEEDGGKA